jgi:hypothetical protein
MPHKYAVKNRRDLKIRKRNDSRPKFLNLSDLHKPLISNILQNKSKTLLQFGLNWVAIQAGLHINSG